MSVNTSSSFTFTYLGGGEDVVPKHVQRVVIHSSVQVIEARAFRDCHDLKAITIPTSVEIIEASAFFGCNSLERVRIPNTVVAIGDGAFYGCSSLMSIELPEGLETVGSGAFYGCTSLRTAIIPRSITIIESYVFNGCTMLAEAKIPDTVTSIGKNAFFRCHCLSSIELPNSVTAIGELAFSECSKAKSLVIPGSVVSIGCGAFSRCYALESVAIPEGVTTIASGAFADCTSLASVEIPDSVNSICAYAFRGCTALAGIRIPKSVTDIDQNAFNGCEALESIVLPDCTTRISPYTFYGCASLKSIVIPETVGVIGAYAFQGCVSLEQILIPSSVTTIGRNAFCRCASLTSITIPFSITSIRELTFSQCTSLTSVIIPESVNVIGESAFEGCSSLVAVTIPQSVTTISWGVFAACASLATILLPAFVATICNFAFAECESLMSVMIPDSLTSIGETAFEGCSSLALITVPQNVKTIGELAFEECTLLEKGCATLSPDVVAWLRVRFKEHPTHEVCHRAGVTASMVACSIDNHPDSVKSLDGLGMSALHVLLLNENVDADMVEELLHAHPSSVQDVGPLGRYPLHLACLVPKTSLSVIKLLSGSYTKDGRLALTVGDDNNEVPCTLAIRYNSSDEAVFHLFERYPVTSSSLRTVSEKRRLLRMCECYIEKLSKETRTSIRTLDPLQRHGWVSFVGSAGLDTHIAKMCIRLVHEAPVEILGTLAYCKDLNGRLAIESTTKDIRVAFETKLLNRASLERLRREPLAVSPITGIMVSVGGRTAENSVKAVSEFAGGSIIEHGRRIGEQRFRKLLKRFNIDLSCANEIDRNISQETCVELCKDVLDNVQPRHFAVKLMRSTERFRRRIDCGLNIKLDSGYQFGANYHLRNYVNRVVSDALRSFKVGDGFNNDANTPVMPLSLGKTDSTLSTKQSNPIRLREFARQLTEAVATAPPHDKKIVDVDDASKGVVQLSHELPLVAVEAPPEVDADSRFTSKALPLDVHSRLSRSDRRRFDNLVHAIEDIDLDGSIDMGSSEACQATFFAVKTYLTEVVSHEDEIVVKSIDLKRAPATTNLAFRIIRRFCPGVPKNCISQKLVRKVEAYVLKTKTRGDGEHVLTRKTVEKKDLLDFLAFLKDIDDDSSSHCRRSDSSAGSMRRVSRKKNGKARWMSTVMKMKTRLSEMRPESAVATTAKRDDSIGNVEQHSKLSAFLRVTPSRTRSSGPRLNPPSFLIYFLRHPQMGFVQPFLQVAFGQQRDWKKVLYPFTKPLFQLPSFHRLLWKEHLQLSSSSFPTWQSPHSPFLCPLFPLPSLRLQSWDDLFHQTPSQNQVLVQPVVDRFGFLQ